MRQSTGNRLTWLAGGAVVVAVVALLWAASDPARIGSQGKVAAEPTGAEVGALTTSTPLTAAAATCTGAFVEHELDHETRSAQSPSRLFDANGAGVAADDLDGDGLVDIVLANLDAPSTILWNEGDWRFTTDRLDDRSVRSVATVDVDGDGRLDIVTTHRAAGLRWWRNTGERTFESVALLGVAKPAYAMSWADVDLDGDLDLATGAYDAELDQRMRSSYLFSDGAGVFVYHRQEGDTVRFDAERLVQHAQALTVGWLDLDLDGDDDLMVGNDFNVHDAFWERGDDGTLTPIEPFVRTTAHTMSVETGDVDGDGVEELFATDMKPYSTDVEVLAAWMPLIAGMEGLDNPNDVQRIRNVLQVRRPDGSWHDQGDAAGVDAAGWAWSGRFGDLDDDGDLDLHVVNGMIAKETFPYLPGAELVEHNFAYANNGTGLFVDRPEWGLGSTLSGRGSIVVDLDRDGRLDIVVNNMEGPAMAFQNRTCGGGAVEFDLRMPGTANSHAIGAKVTVRAGDRTWVRYVRSNGGYLSGSPSTLHVGLGDTTTASAEVRWPDGTISTIPDITAGSRYEVTLP